MSKIVSESHVTGDKGVAAFHQYCANHIPFIIWRAETVNDFGIDGEVELTSLNSNGKLEATGEILKVQIKSTLKGSYIHKETTSAFEFKPREEDVEYWDKHKLDVILIIFKEDTNLLYAKKISKLDEGHFKKKIPIEISKADNVLTLGKNDFLERFSSCFKQRVNFNVKEQLYANIFKFSKLPKVVYQFDPLLQTPKEIFAQIPDTERPVFLFHAKKIHTFFNPNGFPKFKEHAINYASKKELQVRDLLKDIDSRKLLAELMNLEFKQFCYGERIGFNKQYGRYFFMAKNKTSEKRIEYYDSKSKRKDAHRTVVSFHEYKPTNFFRHFSFETKYLFDETGLFLVINPQYLFTSDGLNPLEDKAQITKLTNYLTSRERNQQVFNHVHFIFSFLAKGSERITLSVLDNAQIELSSYQVFNVNFGVPIDNKNLDKPDTHYDKSSQQNIFE
ncbi:MAG: hypothetical protein OJF59_001831 [Cytophagales bacterium]|jgi:hypothetical protein|nr:DUF4365 domain-containing protein [Bacteroidota bacterium]MBS1950699.1 DUF4365 domain-containing protein [Bacteroidota bacterium]MBS1980741.1 DUF4365 domain-containing protein [Bacteroidota bacterium]WHZ08078.1 MAG: hypothetical protein OJF59_001831 [Cytophagales bacterium]